MAEQKEYRDLPRCPLPVIFLDTHVISNIAKWKIGKKLDKVTLDRAKIVYEYVYRLVRAKKMICPEIPTWQDEYRLDTRIDGDCEKMVVELSHSQRFFFLKKFQNRPVGYDPTLPRLTTSSLSRRSIPVVGGYHW